MADYILNMGGLKEDKDTSPFINTVDVFKVTSSGVEHVTDHGLSLSVARHDVAAASCGNYILAMGGTADGDMSNAVDVFKVTTNGVEAVTDHGLSLSAARSHIAAASCGEYILAMGGDYGSSGYYAVDVFQVTSNGVEYITDHSLSLSSPRYLLAAASCGNYILAMGGNNGSTYSGAVDVFQVTSNRVEHITDHALSLSVPRYFLSAASCGEYILAMGGYTASGVSNAVDVFQVTANGVEAVQDHGLSLSEPRYAFAAASCGNYILAVGGRNETGYTATVDVFKVTSSGVEHVTDHGLSLSVARYLLSSASAGNYILAMGGLAGGSERTNTVDVFQINNKETM